MPNYTWVEDGHLAAYGLLAGFTAIAVWETVRPLRTPSLPTGRRWVTHALVWLLNNAAGLWVLRIGMGVIAAAAAHGGLLGFGTNEQIPLVARVTVFVLLLDLLRYALHYLFHSIPLLWRIHQVHHSDAEFDVTTGLRFHPFETLLEQVAFLGLIFLIGPPPIAVAVFGGFGALQDMFVHANASSPGMERLLRRFLITPDMHRLHHSIRIEEQNRNFGFVFPWWDRLFRTYAARTDQVFPVGLEGYQDRRSMSIWRIFAMPFWSGVSEVPPADARIEAKGARTEA